MHLHVCGRVPLKTHPTYQGQQRGKPYLEVWSSPQLKMAGMNIPNAVKFWTSFWMPEAESIQHEHYQVNRHLYFSGLNMSSNSREKNSSIDLEHLQVKLRNNNQERELRLGVLRVYVG